jgi:hypothetical protein
MAQGYSGAPVRIAPAVPPLAAENVVTLADRA